jgi:hypothetical protein
VLYRVRRAKARFSRGCKSRPATFAPAGSKEINPKTASDIAYWSKEFGATGDQLHEVIRSHGTHVGKIRAALHTHKGA